MVDSTATFTRIAHTAERPYEELKRGVNSKVESFSSFGPLQGMQSTKWPPLFIPSVINLKTHLFLCVLAVRPAQTADFYTHNQGA